MPSCKKSNGRMMPRKIPRKAGAMDEKILRVLAYFYDEIQEEAVGDTSQTFDLAGTQLIIQPSDVPPGTRLFMYESWVEKILNV